MGSLVTRETRREPRPLTALLIRTIISKVGRSDVNRVRAKQVLVEQVMYREQENSHPEWSDYTIFGEI